MAKFTDSTDEDIIKRIKMVALEKGINANDVLNIAFELFSTIETHEYYSNLKKICIDDSVSELKNKI